MEWENIRKYREISMKYDVIRNKNKLIIIIYNVILIENENMYIKFYVYEIVVFVYLKLCISYKVVILKVVCL